MNLNTTINIISDGVAAICFLAILIAVVQNFMTFDKTRSSKAKKSPVATASMAGFAAVLYFTLKFKLGAFDELNIIPIRLIGSALMLLGAGFNIWGRLYLKGNWSDHVRIYQDQTLISTGPYSIVRHPLYASLIWLFLGAAMSYYNVFAALETILIFVPAMTYRAILEERALAEKFGEQYINYQKNTGRFFPKIWRIKNNV